MPSAPEALIIEHLSEAGFSRFRQQVRLRDFEIDLLAKNKAAAYAIEIKALRDVRDEQLIGTLAVAYLQLRKAIGDDDLVPLVALVAPRWTTRAIDRVIAYAAEFVPDVGLAFADHEGTFVLEARSIHVAHHPARKRRLAGTKTIQGNLFTDLNQWLLKVLVKDAWHLSDSYVTGPAAVPSTPQSLARAARVSVGRAWTLNRLLVQEGFLADSLIRVPELLERWSTVPQHRQRIAARWLIRTASPIQRLVTRLGNHATWTDGAIAWRPGVVRACLAGHAAAHGLGHGFVSGPTPEAYVEHIDAEVFKSFEARPASPEQQADFMLVVPRFRESVFRACVAFDGAPVADVIQTWVDLVHRPDRGREQADVLRKRILHG